jgi:hypothetical protein
VDDKGRRHRDWALLKQNVASFVVGILGIMLFIATSSSVVLVLTMAVLFFLPPISRFRAWRNRPKQ